MSSTIELFLDQHTCKVIRSVWKVLEEKKIGAPLYSTGAFPHISLFTYEKIDETRCREVLTEAAERIAKLSIRFSHLGTFRQKKNVVYLGAERTEEMDELREQISAGLTQYSDTLWPYYGSESWIPHSTMATDLQREELERARETASRIITLPLISRAHKVALVEFAPVKHIFSLEL